MQMKSSRKFEKKVIERVSTQIEIRQVHLSNLINTIEDVVKNILSLYKNLCDVKLFTKENQDFIDRKLVDLRASTHSLNMDPSSSSNYFNKLTFYQGRLAELLVNNGTLRAKFNSI